MRHNQFTPDKTLAIVRQLRRDMAWKFALDLILYALLFIAGLSVGSAL